MSTARGWAIKDYKGLEQRLMPDQVYGTWHMFENTSVRFAQHRPGGWHPWVLVQPSSSDRPFSIALPRSRTAFEGFPHPPHPSDHGCRIVDEGRLAVLEKRSVPRELIVATPVECIEPDPDALRALLKGRRR